MRALVCSIASATGSERANLTNRAVWLFGICVAIAVSFQAAAQERRAVRIATEGASPPFNYVDQNNELQGFEVELGKALCNAMHAECSFVLHEWDGIIRGLINREYDAIMASLAITERRKKRIAFSRRYYLLPAAFIGPKDSDVTSITPDALAGKRLGTTERSEHHSYLAAFYGLSEIQTYSKLEEANLDLMTGRIDLVLGDKLSLVKFLDSREGTCCRVIADVPPNPLYHGEGVAVGLRKDDTELKDAFDKAIEKVIADGTYDRIRSKYFPIDIK